MRSDAPYINFEGIFSAQHPYLPSQAFFRPQNPCFKKAKTVSLCSFPFILCPDGIRTFCGVSQKCPEWQTGHFPQFSGIVPVFLWVSCISGGYVLMNIDGVRCEAWHEKSLGKKIQFPVLERILNYPVKPVQPAFHQFMHNNRSSFVWQ